MNRLQTLQLHAEVDAIHISDLESAINHWRTRRPCGDDAMLSPEVAVLAEVYSLMILHGVAEIETVRLSQQALDAWVIWYATTKDTPCIAICSTSQGDARCRGCGRTEQEVHEWLSLSPFAKRKVWRRITNEGQALRFNRYSERAWLQ